MTKRAVFACALALLLASVATPPALAVSSPALLGSTYELDSTSVGRYWSYQAEVLIEGPTTNVSNLLYHPSFSNHFSRRLCVSDFVGFAFPPGQVITGFIVTTRASRSTPLWARPYQVRARHRTRADANAITLSSPPFIPQFPGFGLYSYGSSLNMFGLSGKYTETDFPDLMFCYAVTAPSGGCSPPPCSAVEVFLDYIKVTFHYKIDTDRCPSYSHPHAVAALVGPPSPPPPACTKTYGVSCNVIPLPGYQHDTGSTTVITCSASGTWTGAASVDIVPIPGNCAVPYNPSVDVTNNDLPGTPCNGGTSEVCTADCALGYANYNGPVSSTCQASTDWSPAFAPFCPPVDGYCGEAEVEQGELGGSCTSRVHEECTALCNSGYNTSQSIQCLPDNMLTGVWSGSIACAPYSGYCAPMTGPGVPDPCDGTITGMCTFECSPGYIDVAVHTCVTGGSEPGTGMWSEPPDCRVFNGYCSPLVVPNGMQPCNGTLGEVCTYECDFGYHNAGPLAHTCTVSTPGLGGGVWSPATLPNCTLSPGYCSAPDILADGAWSPSLRRLGDTVSPSCDFGYELSETPPFPSCTAATSSVGAWDPPLGAFACFAIATYCPLPPTPNNGSTAGCGRTVGSSCTPVCDLGYEPTAVTPVCVAFSEAAGVWSPGFPVPSLLCTPVSCPALGVLGNGSQSAVSGATGDVVTFECLPGYDLVGAAAVTCEPSTVAASAWSAPIPYCQPRPCVPTAPIANGVFVPPHTLTMDESVSYVCNDGYGMVGSADRTCTASGNFSGVPPACVAHPCLPDFAAPGNGSVTANGTAVTGGSVTFSCRDGFFLRGTEVRTCDPVLNAEYPAWSNSSFDVLECSAFSCQPPLEHPVHGAVNTRFGIVDDTATFSCDQGWSLEAQNSTRTCTATGNWTGTSPTCEPIPCPLLGAPTNGLVNGTTGAIAGKTLDRATVSCLDGYVLVPPTRTEVSCTIFSTWEPVMPTCNTVPCAALPPVANAVLSTSTGATGSSAVVTCDPGYHVVGTGAETHTATLVCEPTGPAAVTWNPSSAACTLLQAYCPPRVAPANGAFVSGSDPLASDDPATWPTVAACSQSLGSVCGRGACERGFETSGEVEAECRAGGVTSGSGVWSAAAPTCTPCGAGTYAVFDGTGARSWTCAACPLGGVCAGGDSVPIAQRGWWEDPATRSFLSCVPPETCEEGRCRRGHRGFKCTLCENGWYKKDGTFCVGCPPSKEIVYPILIVLAIVLCVVLVKLARKSTHYFASLAVGASFLQMISILPSFQTKWPSFVTSFFKLFSVFALDLSQFFEPQCMVNQGSSPFVLVWSVKMALPLIFLGIFSVGGVLGCVYYVVRKQVPSAKLVSCSARASRMFPPLSRLGLKVFLWSCLNAFLTCLVLCYIVLTSAALSIYGCTKQADGTVTMNAEPALECKSTTWNNMVAVSVVVLFVYGCGFPAAIFVVLRRRRYSLWKEKNIIRYGLLYQRYLRKFYLYELVLLVRKFLFVFGKALFPNSPQAQVCWALATVVGGIGVQFAAAPFRDGLINHLELLTLVAAAFVLGLGVAYDASADSMGSGAEATVGAVVVSIVVLTVIAIGVAVAMAIRKQWKLVRAGVASGYGSDELVVMPLFFEFGMRIVSQERVVTPHAVVWSLVLTTTTPLPLVGRLSQESVALGASAEEVLHDVDGAPEAYMRVGQARDARTSYVSILIPCRGVYSARLVVDEGRARGLANGVYSAEEWAAVEEAMSPECSAVVAYERAKRKDRVGEVAAMDGSGGDGASLAGTVVDFSFASEFGCSELQRGTVVRARAAELEAVVHTPFEYVLPLGERVVVTAGLPRASRLVLSYVRCAEVGADPRFELDDGALAGRVGEADEIPLFLTDGELRQAAVEAPVAGFLVLWAEVVAADAVQNWRGVDQAAETEVVLVSSWKFVAPELGISGLSELERFRDSAGQLDANVYSARLRSATVAKAEGVEGAGGVGVAGDDGVELLQV